MAKRGHSEEEILRVLREAESGTFAFSKSPIGRTHESRLRSSPSTRLALNLFTALAERRR